MPLSAESRLQRDPTLISVPMDGEFVTMSIDHGEYFGIGGVGARAWELLENPVTLTALCATICTEFEVEEADCMADMSRFAEELRELGLVREITEDEAR